MKKKTSLRTIVLRILMLLLAVYMVVTLLDMQVKLATRQEEFNSLQQQVELQEVENKELERKINAGLDDDKLDREAREILDYAGEDEGVFIDISGS